MQTEEVPYIQRTLHLDLFADCPIILSVSLTKSFILLLSLHKILGCSKISVMIMSMNMLKNCRIMPSFVFL